MQLAFERAAAWRFPLLSPTETRRATGLSPRRDNYLFSGGGFLNQPGKSWIFALCMVTTLMAITSAN